MSNRLGIISENEAPEKNYLIRWEGPFCTIKDKKFLPKIEEEVNFDQSIHNTLTIELDGKTNASLDWKESLIKADNAIEKGSYIFWKLNLGLFSELNFSIFNQTQLSTLILAIEHFKKAVWEKYYNHTIGICLYQGEMDLTFLFDKDPAFEKQFQIWKQDYSSISDESLSTLSQEMKMQFSCDLCVDYLDLLSHHLPDEIESFVLFDTKKINNLVMQARILSSERSDRLKYIVKNGLLPAEHLSWDHNQVSFGYYGKGTEHHLDNKASLGICLPEISKADETDNQTLNEILLLLIDNNYCFRILPEANLTAEWDGLDTLIVTGRNMTTFGVRKLQGFSAAGGEIISVNEIPNLPYQINYADWKKDHISS